MNWFQYLMWLMTRNTKGPAVPSAPQPKPLPAPGSVFDDFDGPAGSLPNPALWEVIPGFQQGVATSSAADVYIDGSSNLVVTAENDGSGWRMGWLASYGLKEYGYGTFKASMKMAPGAGLDCAFWLLGQTVDPSVASPNDVPTWGEIDIIEEFGGRYYNTIHGPMYGGAPWNQSQVSGPLQFDPAADFHTYWCNHQPQLITFGIDATTTAVIRPSMIPSGAPWLYDQPFTALFGIGVGGLPGNPDATTPNPARMLVDWFYWQPTG